ncbi:hypothetical protein ACFL0K_02845 [Patescibacteria group bacterium]
MLHNSKYNLMRQLVEENCSLWRIKDAYLQDAQNDEEKEFWNKLGERKEELVKELEEMISKQS